MIQPLLQQLQQILTSASPQHLPIPPSVDSRVIESSLMDTKPLTRKEKDRIRFKARRKEVRREAAALIRQRKEAQGEAGDASQVTPPQSAPPPSLPAPSAQPVRVQPHGQSQQQQMPPVGRGGRGGVRGAFRGLNRHPQPQKQAPKGKPSLPRGGWQEELPRVMADPRWNMPS